MSATLAGPLLAAAALLCVSAVAKLRAPASAAAALGTLGLRAPLSLIRALSALELALGLGGLLLPGRASALALAVVYTGFAGLTVALRGARASCGCFGEMGAPASATGAALSAGVAGLCAVAAVAGHLHGLGWVLGRPPMTVGTLLIGVAGCVLALTVAYTELPRAWSAWEGR